jgi:hypothetical protein
MVRVKRILGAALVLLVLPTVLSACGDDGASQSDVQDLEDALDAAREGVVHDLAAATEVVFASGTRRFNWCGESYAPRGVFVTEHLLFEPSPLGNEGAVAKVATVLEEQGWSVERPANPDIVIGTKDLVEVRVEVGGAAFQLDLRNAECLETTDGVARDVNDRDSEDVRWEDDGPAS